ncbi:hypothetical protein Tco_1141530 [Tanacetum coccineum]
MANGVNGSGLRVTANDVNGYVPCVTANGVDGFQVMANGVSGSVPHVVANGVMANGVNRSAAQAMTNSVSGSVSQVMVDGPSSSLGEVAFESVPQVDKERLLGWFNQKVVKDLARLDNVEKGTRSLLMMKETEDKIGEKARCDELCRSSYSEEWEDMFILYCRRVAVEDSSLERETNGLCSGLAACIEEREYFIDELDVLVDRFVLEKMAEFLKETQDKDRNRLMKLQVLGREFELRAGEKNHFIEKLKG